MAPKIAVVEIPYEKLVDPSADLSQEIIKVSHNEDDVQGFMSPAVVQHGVVRQQKATVSCCCCCLCRASASKALASSLFQGCQIIQSLGSSCCRWLRSLR